MISNMVIFFKDAISECVIWGPEFVGNFYRSLILHYLLEHMAETVLNLDCNIVSLIYYIKVGNCKINNQKKWFL